MNIAIIGASGFVGKNLLEHLLKNTAHKITAISRNIENIKIDDKYKNRVKIIKADASNYNEMLQSLFEIEVAYYFAHGLYNFQKLYKKESQMAENTGRALLDSGVTKVIYLSGLGNEKEKLSTHLSSRHNTGKILKKYINQVIEFRASIVIGDGSISFEIIKDLINNSPIILLPKEAKTKTQPILKEDVISYLIAGLNLTENKSQIIEIGGPEVMSYKELLKKYRDLKNKKTPIIIVPFLNQWVARFFIRFFTSKENAIVSLHMVNSFKNEMIVTNKKAKELFPQIIPSSINENF